MKNLSYALNVDLDVYKALTALIGTEGQTHNDVLRGLLKLDSLVESENPYAGLMAFVEPLLKTSTHGEFYSRGLSLPEGTKLRARYKGREYLAQILNGAWIDEDGKQQVSPSAAATRITDTTVNGLRFWEGWRPGDNGWRRLDVIRDSLR